MRELNVLVSSAGRRVSLLRLFRASLRSLGVSGRVLATDMSPLSAAFHDADEGLLVPPCRSDDFVGRMIELCREHSVGLIVPTIDPELPAYAAARKQLAAIGTAINLSGADTIAIGGDKRVTHRWLTEGGFPTVRQGSPEDVLREPDAWPWPLIAKPAAGSASAGVVRVSGPEQLAATASTASDLVVQEIAPGHEYTVDVFVDRHGRCRCAVPRRRLEVRSGEVSKGVTVRAPAIIELASRVAEALPGGFGAMNVQIFASEDGTLNVIELNPRFGGGFPLSAAAGADATRWLLEEVLDLPSTANDGWRDNVVMLRFDEAVFVEDPELVP